MTDMFFYGTLCHPPLLACVLGRAVDLQPASLPDHAVHWAEGGAFPILLPRPGARAEGVLVRGLSAADVARLDYYEAGFAFDTFTLPVQVGTEAVPALVYVPRPGQWRPAAPWVLADWQARHGDEVTATAGDVMALYGVKPAEAVLARYPQMLVRGAARVRARQTAPARQRAARGPQDLALAARREPYARFFAVEEYDIAWRRFDGSLSASVTRAVFLSGDAVTVLPYDPVRDRVLVVEQFRAGPYGRGDANPWQLEAVAGRIDPGETPEHAARREAVEEAGLHLGALEEVARYYPSPGICAEFLYSYVALCDLPDGAAGVFGVAEEAEDIRGHLIGFDDLMRLVASGEIGNAPLLLSILWLQRERARLRAG